MYSNNNTQIMGSAGVGKSFLVGEIIRQNMKNYISTLHISFNDNANSPLEKFKVLTKEDVSVAYEKALLGNIEIQFPVGQTGYEMASQLSASFAVKHTLGINKLNNMVIILDDAQYFKDDIQYFLDNAPKLNTQIIFVHQYLHQMRTHTINSILQKVDKGIYFRMGIEGLDELKSFWGRDFMDCMNLENFSYLEISKNGEAKIVQSGAMAQGAPASRESIPNPQMMQTDSPENVSLWDKFIKFLKGLFGA